MTRRKVLYHLFECPGCHKTIRLTLSKRQVKEVLKGMREVCDIRREIVA